MAHRGRGRGASSEFPALLADDHVVARGVQHPIIPLSRVVIVARHFDEALVQREIVTDGVLPALPVVPVIREIRHDKLVDAVEGEPFLGGLPDGHHDEGVVAERRFRVLFGGFFRGIVR